MGGDSIEDYRRVRKQEYYSAAVFTVAMLVCGGMVYKRMQENETIASLIYCFLVISSGSLARSSFEQGKVMSRKVNELEQKLNQL
ncbi:MAG TPA: hypothetical protein VJA18_01685 [Candidatus Nanoarchaeia archaeon]|nr:hypothetical protein [Candidatus Nanoarchaeia archaeon]